MLYPLVLHNSGRKTGSHLCWNCSRSVRQTCFHNYPTLIVNAKDVKAVLPKW